MKQLLFIFCLSIVGILQASDLPTDSLHSHQFHKKINFYLKYSTQSEARDILCALELMKKTTNDHSAANYCLLLQEESNLIEAENRSKKIVSTIPDLYQAHEDIGIAVWNCQCYDDNENAIQRDLDEITRLQQMIKTRMNLLQLRAERRALTAEQESLHEHKMQYERDESIRKSRVAQLQKHQIQLAYKSSIKRVVPLTQEEKEEVQQKEKERSILQSLAFNKGIQAIVCPTDAERLAQSERDKIKAAEQARELAENIAMKHAEDASIKAFSTQHATDLAITPVKHSRKTTHKSNKKKPVSKKKNNYTKNNFTVEDPLESINNKFTFFLQSARLREDNQNKNFITVAQVNQIKNALEKLQTQIDNDKELLCTHTSTPKISENLRELDTLIDEYAIARQENDNEIDLYNKRATDLVIDGKTYSPEQRFAFLKSKDFEKMYKTQQNRLIDSRKKSAQAQEEAKFKILYDALKSAVQDELIFKQCMYLEQSSDILHNLRNLLHQQTKNDINSVDGNDKNDNIGVNDAADDDYGFALAACIIS